ncbi:hypothetical protein MZC50_09060 [Yersinia pestis subsp. pestis]|uniref:hypothetical protein n=1 Tax=Yersinia pestis TaxID=632 RepID=UPI0021F2BA74|nr:hypothetical protein [Yersinia pestis]MCV6862045.1 hypothetical protein [Yersinia pestis subsp. pestis]
MLDQTVTLEDFADLVADEGLTPEALEAFLSIIAEIRIKAESFQANSPELVQLAALYSPKFQMLPAARQEFFASVMTMPIFFMTLPMGEEDADQWMKESK